MKILLILFNILLTILLVWGIADRFGSASRKKTVYTVKKTVPGKRESVQAVPAVSVPVMTAAEQMDAVLRANIFNQERCPNTVPGRSARLELSLVGTFKIGDCTGAIIKQKASGNNNFMPFGGGMPFGPRQMGIAGNRAGNMANSRGGFQNRGNMSNSRGGFLAGGPFNNRNNGAVSSGAYKQYVRLGETLPNGYKLVEVSRNRVVLTRGGDKLELELLDASKNATQTAARSTNARGNVNTQMLQTLQNMQRMQMFQNMQMMRMMQNNQNSGFPQGGGNFGNGGGRGGTSARNRGGTGR